MSQYHIIMPQYHTIMPHLWKAQTRMNKLEQALETAMIENSALKSQVRITSFEYEEKARSAKIQADYPPAPQLIDSLNSLREANEMLRMDLDRSMGENAMLQEENLTLKGRLGRGVPGFERMGYGRDMARIGGLRGSQQGDGVVTLTIPEWREICDLIEEAQGVLGARQIEPGFPSSGVRVEERIPGGGTGFLNHEVDDLKDYLGRVRAQQPYPPRETLEEVIESVKGSKAGTPTRRGIDTISNKSQSRNVEQGVPEWKRYLDRKDSNMERNVADERNVMGSSVDQPKTDSVTARSSSNRASPAAPDRVRENSIARPEIPKDMRLERLSQISSRVMPPPRGSFDDIDKNGDGFIDRSEFQQHQNGNLARDDNMMARLNMMKKDLHGNLQALERLKHSHPVPYQMN